MSLFFRSDRRQMTVPDGWSSWYPDGGPVDGRATHLAPVFASIRHIVDYVSTLPVDFYRKSDGLRSATSTPELIRNVESEYGLDTWLGQIAYGIATRGNAVGHITSSGQSGPTMIEWAHNWSTVGEHETDPWFLDGFSYGYRSVAQVRWITPPGRRLGLSPIEHFASMVRAGLAAQDYANIGRGGGLPLAELTNTMLSEMPKELIDAAASSAVSAFASGRPFVHGKDWKLDPVTIPQNQVQFIETLKMSANGIASIYGIDPEEVGGSRTDSLTYANDESRPIRRAYNMRPYLTRIEAAVNRWIAGPVYMKFNIDATIRADIKTRTDVIGAQIQDGRLSLNEARALEDRPPVDGGDFHNVPSPTADKTARKEQQ